MFTHVFDDLLHGNIDGVFYDALVQIANDALDYTELLEQLSPCIEHLVGENIFFTIDPKVGKSFLG